jgi:hypothetical protein
MSTRHTALILLNINQLSYFNRIVIKMMFIKKHSVAVHFCLTNTPSTQKCTHKNYQTGPLASIMAFCVVAHHLHHFVSNAADQQPFFLYISSIS